MKVLFLDLDGVLRSNQSGILNWRKKGNKLFVLDEVCCSNLQAILEVVPDLKIVISSTWRKVESIDFVKYVLRKYGVDSSRVIGHTPIHFGDRGRGHEIQEWFDDWKEEHPEDPIEKFVIVDDDSDMYHLRDNLVQTNYDAGLSWAKADDILCFFGKSMHDWDVKFGQLFADITANNPPVPCKTLAEGDTSTEDFFKAPPRCKHDVDGTDCFECYPTKE